MVAPFVKWGGSREELLEQLAEHLRKHGYSVIPKDRRVIVTSRYMVPPMDLERGRFNEPRYEDMVRSTNLQKLIRHADDHGFIVHAKQDLDDPVTGREVIFTSAMRLVRPLSNALASTATTSAATPSSRWWRRVPRRP